MYWTFPGGRSQAQVREVRDCALWYEIVLSGTRLCQTANGAKILARGDWVK
jgi:hypothetical protein